LAKSGFHERLCSEAFANAIGWIHRNSAVAERTLLAEARSFDTIVQAQFHTPAGFSSLPGRTAFLFVQIPSVTRQFEAGKQRGVGGAACLSAVIKCHPFRPDPNPSEGIGSYGRGLHARDLRMFACGREKSFGGQGQLTQVRKTRFVLSVER